MSGTLTFELTGGLRASKEENGNTLTNSPSQNGRAFERNRDLGDLHGKLKGITTRQSIRLFISLLKISS